MQKPTASHFRRHEHWHHLYHKRRSRAQRVSPKQIALGQVLSLIGAVLAGLHLDNNKASLALIVGAFVILPGVFDLNGALGGALSAKINHRLEVPGARPYRVVLRSTAFALLIAVLAGTMVGVMGGLIASSLFDANFITILKLCLGSIFLSALIGFPLVACLTLLLRSLGINPDDVMGPIETSFFDFLTVMTLVTVVGWLV